MKSKISNFFTKKRMVALITTIIIILETFSPYSILIRKSYAGEPASGEPYYQLSIREFDDTADEDNWSDENYYYYYDYYRGDIEDIENYTGTRVIFIDLSINGCDTVNAGDINLKYDGSKLIPVHESYKGAGKNKVYFLENASEFENPASKSSLDFATINWSTPVGGVSALDSSSCTIRTAGSEARDKYLKNGAVVGTFMFKLADGVTKDDLDSSVFSLQGGAGLTSGLQIAYYPDGKQKNVKGKDYLLFKGFAAGAKKINNISFKSQPTKNKYYNTETLDFTGAILTASYDDGSSEDVTVSDAITSGKITLDSTTANNTTKKTTLTYDGETIDFDYYVLDSISKKTNLTKMNYEHGDTIDFSGGQLTATYKDSSGNTLEDTLNIASKIATGEITVDKTKADVDNKKVTFTYKSLTTDMTLTVTDPVSSISITKQPTNVTYNDGDTISLAGGEITPVTKSGKTLTPISADDSKVTASSTTASISSIPASDRWVIAGGNGLTAGNQKITLTYEGKTADLNIVVNDTVSGVSITTQPTAQNKYGTSAGALNYSGLVATITTSGGGSFTVGASSLAIDTSGYKPTELAKQSLPVKYGTINSTNTVDIQLVNYITGITTTFTKTEFDYGTSLDDVISNGKYVEVYADGSSSSPKTITAGMVTGYVQKPAGSLFNVNHKYNETLTIKLDSSSNAFDKLPATATQVITINDVIKDISVLYKPSKVTYKYGEAFSATGGQININYISGAQSNISMEASGVTLTEQDGSTINMSPSASSFVSGTATKTIKVSYTSNGKIFDTSFDIYIKDETASISISKNPKTIFNHGDTFDESAGELKIVYKSGNSEVINLNQAVVTESDGSEVDMEPKYSKYTNNNLVKNLLVTYRGQTTNYDITLQNTIDSIAIENTPKQSYKLNEATTGVGGTIKVTRKAGNTESINIDDSMVSGLDTTVAGTGKNATITYTDEFGNLKTTTYTYDVIDNVTSIDIVAPSKNVYNHGEALALDGTITVHYASGTTNNVTMTSSMIKEGSGAVDMSPTSYDDDTQKVNKKLTIEYSEGGVTKSIDYPITIINDVKSIAVQDPATKTTYNIGDTLDVTGLSILVTRAMGTTGVVTVTPDMVTGFDSSKENTNLSLTISYTENGITKTATYEVSVVDSVKSITINGTPQSEVKYGEEFDLSKIKLDVTKGSGTIQETVTDSMISGYDKTKIGKQTVTITYGGQTTTFDVTVKDYVTKIEVNPSSVTGTYNDELSKLITDNNIKYTVTYAKAGAQSPIALAESMVSGYNKATTTAQNLTITYTDNDSSSYTNGNNFTTSLQVTLMNTVSGITITPPTKTTYNHGDSLDLTGGEINLTYEDGTSGTLDINKATITESDGSPVNMSPASYDGTQKVDKTLKIEYSKDGQTGTVNYPITIINDVKSITIKTLPQTEYKVNETLDITTGELLVTKAVGTEIVTMSSPKVTVSGFDNTQESKDLKLTVDYTENGITKTTDYLVNVTDNVQSISLKTMPPTNYKYGEPLNVTGGQIEVVKDSGVQTINITNDMIKELDGSEFDSTKLGTRKLQISYGGKTLEYEITVEDYVTGIILTTPTKLVYECGEELDLTGGKIEKVMASGTKIDVALSDSSVSISGYDKTKAGSQTINVIYEGITKQFGVTVEDNVQSVTLIGTPKTEYKYGESLDVAGLQLEVTSSSGNKQYVTVTPSKVTGFNSNQLGEQILIITYKGKTVQYKVNVKDYVKDIEIVEPTKLVYKLNETIDLSGGTVRAVMASGTATSPVAMTSAMITGFDSTSIGAKTLTVSYQGYTKTFGITVQDLTNSMVIKTLPNKVKYLYGQKLDLTGGTIEITKESGETEIISITSSMVTGYNSNKLGTQTLTVTYDGLSQTFPVTVEDYELNSLFITPPTKRNYEYGESLDLTGGKVTTKMASGAIKESTNMTASMISGFDNTKVGSQKITVTYDGKSNSFTISVKDSIKGISMNTQPNKTNYDFGANLDVSGATITVVKSSGITVIPVTSDMISEYNPKNAGTQVIKVSYGGFTTNFIVNVLPKKNSTKDSNTKDNTNINRHHNKTNNNNNEEANIPNQEETKDNQITNDNVQENQNTKPKENTKEEDNKEVPKNNTKDDKKQEDKDIERNKGINKKSIAAIIAAIALGILILIIVFKRNVRILIEEDGEFVLGGLDKVSNNNLKLDIDQYLDKDTYDNKVKVVFNDSISKKLDGKIIEINYKNRVFKYKIHYADKPFEINLDNSVINRIEVIK